MMIQYEKSTDPMTQSIHQNVDNVIAQRAE